MSNAPSALNLALLLGLSFFLGLAFEDFFAHAGAKRPGGIRTFPLLALAGGMLYWFDSTHFVPFTAGLVILGTWLSIFYREHIHEHDAQGVPNVGLMVLLLNVYAYLLGPITLALPNWVAVATTVIAVLLLTGREQLHDLARRLEMKEIVIAGQFLILTGIILPLLPAEPVTTLTSITPRQAWLAVVAVCTLSYASYLAQRYLVPTTGGLWTAALGGLYSSTATTIVLARQASNDDKMRPQAQVGITLATGIMYLRILALVAVFNLPLASRLAAPLVSLSIAALSICGFQYWLCHPFSKSERISLVKNPLELGAAATFAIMFILISLLSAWVTSEFGVTGVYSLAAIIGFADIDPFVLNLAQSTSAAATAAIAPAILIATSSNNVLKACYSALFAGGSATVQSAVALGLLAVAGLVVAFVMAGFY
jgi:uncharacterized membrane protein (DUF4010 family)